MKVEPFELTLNGKKRKIEVIDFFCNADARLHFLLSNILKDNNNFELQWIEEHIGKFIGFSENRSNVLVVSSNHLDLGQNKEEKEKIKQNSDLVKDLKVDWKNITILDNGLTFDLVSPQSISINNRKFTYEKIFYPDDYSKEDLEWLKKRLIEWKENQKIPVIKDAILSTKSWLSVKNSSNLYVIDYNHNKGCGIEGLHDEWFSEIVLRKDFSGWDKLPYQQKRNFVKRYYKVDKKELEDLKKEIEKAIKELKNDNNNDDNNEPEPNQKIPVKNNSASEFPWKIVIGITLFCLVLVVVVILLLKKFMKSSKKV